MLVCGSDLLESFGTPGVWIPEQVSPFLLFFIRKIEYIIISKENMQDAFY